jgi:hypothetical protein
MRTIRFLQLLILSGGGPNFRVQLVGGIASSMMH